MHAPCRATGCPAISLLRIDLVRAIEAIETPKVRPRYPSRRGGLKNEEPSRIGGANRRALARRPFIRGDRDKRTRRIKDSLERNPDSPPETPRIRV